MVKIINDLNKKIILILHFIGYIIKLWKDSKDIEFVKQTIGHRKLDTLYVNKLSDQERQKRINDLSI